MQVKVYFMYHSHWLNQLCSLFREPAVSSTYRWNWWLCVLICGCQKNASAATIILTTCCIYLNIKLEFFSKYDIWKIGCHLVIVHKVKHILHKYFPENWRLWRGCFVAFGMWYNLAFSPYLCVGLLRSQITVEFL